MTGPFPRAGSSRRGVCRAPAPPPDAAPDRPDRLRAGGGGQSGAAVTHPGAGGKAGGAGSILAAPGGGRSGAERGTAQGPGRHPALRSPPRRRGLCQGHVSLPPAAMAPRPYTGPGRGAGARHVRRRRRGPVAEHVRGGGTWGRNGARRGSAGARGPAAARKADNGGKTGGAHVVAAAVAVAAQRRGPAAPRGPGLRAAVAATLGPVPPPSAGSPPPRRAPAPPPPVTFSLLQRARPDAAAAQRSTTISGAAPRAGAGPGAPPGGGAWGAGRRPLRPKPPRGPPAARDAEEVPPSRLCHVTGGRKGAELAGNARTARQLRPPRERAVPVPVRAAAAVFGTVHGTDAPLSVPPPAWPTLPPPVSSSGPAAPQAVAGRPAGGRHGGTQGQRGLGRGRGLRGQPAAPCPPREPQHQSSWEAINPPKALTGH
eukprot:XP_025009500.1 collagen alpha-1(I) chain-like [Gallus gallus]